MMHVAAGHSELRIVYKFGAANDSAATAADIFAAHIMRRNAALLNRLCIGSAELAG